MCTLYTLLIKRYLLTLLCHSYAICNFIAYLIYVVWKANYNNSYYNLYIILLLTVKSIAFTGVNVMAKVCNDMN